MGAQWARWLRSMHGRWVWEALRRVSVLELNERMNTIMEGVCGVAVLVGVHRTVSKPLIRLLTNSPQRMMHVPCYCSLYGKR